MTRYNMILIEFSDKILDKFEDDAAYCKAEIAAAIYKTIIDKLGRRP